MCGISGFYYSNSSKVPLENRHEKIKSSVHSMYRRGPDANGISISECQNLFLGHTRLAIQDLDPRSNQPFYSANRRFSIVFNGEIYNFKEIKQSFLSDYSFKTTSDTEVLLELFIRLGASCLQHLRGMFAFAIWDDLEKELFLARDPYGIKPLYFVEEEDYFAFASQINTLVNQRDRKNIEPAGIVGFYLMGSVPDPWTIYKNIFSLEKGSYLVVKNGKIKTKYSWNNFISNWEHQATSFLKKDKIGPAIKDSVSNHLIADVPISVFLSGGIDSSVIASLASEQTDVTGINISFKEFEGTRDDEFPYAKIVADSLGINFCNTVITKEDFENDFDDIVQSIDQPSIDGINTWYASKAAKEQGFKVALSGIGGDELFCGYPSFYQLPKIYQIKQKLQFLPFAENILNFSFYLASKTLKKDKLRYLNEYTSSILRLYLFKRANFLPHEILQLVGEEIFEEGMHKLETSFLGDNNSEFESKISDLNDLSQVSFLESNFYMHNQLLRDSDWASMHHSLELRTPLVDSFLLKSVGKLVPLMTAFSNKELLSSATSKPLPAEILSKPKTGFSTPLEDWINASLEKKLWFLDEDFINLTWSKKWAIALMHHKFS